jgi:hypothetical protein
MRLKALFHEVKGKPKRQQAKSRTTLTHEAEGKAEHRAGKGENVGQIKKVPYLPPRNSHQQPPPIFGSYEKS